MAGRAGARDAHVRGGPAFQLRRIRLGFGGRNGAQAETETSERAELQEITTGTVFEGVHGVSSRQQRTYAVATDLPGGPRQITSL